MNDSFKDWAAVAVASVVFVSVLAACGSEPDAETPYYGTESPQEYLATEEYSDWVEVGEDMWFKCDLSVGLYVYATEGGVAAVPEHPRCV